MYPIAMTLPCVQTNNKPCNRRGYRACCNYDDITSSIFGLYFTHKLTNHTQSSMVKIYSVQPVKHLSKLAIGFAIELIRL